MGNERKHFTGMVINEIRLTNFGAKKINGNVKIPKPYTPCFTSHGYVFEALNSLLDPGFIENREEKQQQNTGIPLAGHPVVGIDFKLGASIVNYSINQPIVQNAKSTHTRKLPKNSKHKKWDDMVTDYHLIPNEPFMTTPSGVINNVIEHLFQDIMKVKRELMLLKIKTAEFSGYIYDDMHVRYGSELINDNEKIKQLCQLNFFASMPRHANFDEELSKIESVMKKFRVGNHHLALMDATVQKLQLDIANDQLNACSKIMKGLTEQIQTEYQFEEIFFAGRIQKLLIQTKRNQQLQEYTHSQIVFYDNPSFMMKYKENIEATASWENEQANITRKIDEEISFQGELENEIMLKSAALQIVLQKIEVIRNENNALRHKFDTTRKAVWDNSKLPFNEIVTHIIEIVEFVGLSYNTLSDLLNDSSLEVADIKNSIAGFVHHVFNVTTEQPQYLFDHICSKKKLSGSLQCFLAQLSNVSFYPTRAQAAQTQQRIMLEDTPRNLQASFSFAGFDSIELNVTPSADTIYKLSKCRKVIAYGDVMKNVLSNLSISDNAVNVGPPFCLLNIKKKMAYFDEREKMFVTDLKNLFAVLRVIKNVCMTNARKLQEHDDFIKNFTDLFENLIARVNEFYLAENEFRSTMLNYLYLCYSEFNIQNTIQSMKQLLLESNKRLTIYRKMLLLGDAIDFDYTATLAAQTTNVLLLEHVQLDPATNNDVYPAYNAKLDNLRSNNGTMFSLQELLLNDFIRFEGHWTILFNCVIGDGENEGLCACVNVDLTRFAFLKTKLKRYENNLFQIPLYEGEFSQLQVYTQFDSLLSQTHFPMIDSSTFFNVLSSVLWLSTIGRIHNCIRRNIPKCLDSCSDFMRMQANKLREEVQTYLRSTRNDAGITVACDLQSVDLKTTDWTRHVVKEIRGLQSLHFYVDGESPNDNDCTIFAIVVYIGYILHYTQQPLLLNQLLKGMQDNNLLSICKYLLKNPRKRFTLVRVEPTILPELRQWFVDTFNDPRQGQQEQQNLNEAICNVVFPPLTRDPRQGQQEQQNLIGAFGNLEIPPRSGPTHKSTPAQSRPEPSTTSRQQGYLLDPNQISTLAGVARSMQGSPSVNLEGIMDIDADMNINDPIPNQQAAHSDPTQATSSAAHSEPSQIPTSAAHSDPTQATSSAAHSEPSQIPTSAAHSDPTQATSSTEAHSLHPPTSTQQAGQPVLRRTNYIDQNLADYFAMEEEEDRRFEEENRSP